MPAHRSNSKPGVNPASNRRMRPASSRRPTHHLLDVRMRRSTARRQRGRRVTRLAVGLVLWVVVAAITYFGFLAVTEKFFFTNPDYNLRHVDVDLDGLMSREDALQITGITLGTNIFKIDLSAAEQALRKIEQIATVRIERTWPDRVSISVRQREPVAWITRNTTNTFSGQNTLLVDAEGIIMTPYRIAPEFWQLPVIYCPDPDALTAGDSLARADLQAALDLIAEHRRRPGSLLDIRSMDISKGYLIEVTDARKTKILFAPKDPAEQLDRLEKLLAHCQETERQLSLVNLFSKKYTPVEFVLANSLPPTGETSP